MTLWPNLAPGTLYGLAILSTLAGNLLLVGSLCNIIVAERASQSGVKLTFGDFCPRRRAHDRGVHDGRDGMAVVGRLDAGL